MPTFPGRSFLVLAAATISLAGPSFGQEEAPGRGEAPPESQGGVTPFQPIPEGFELVHRDDLDAEDSLSSFWFSRGEEWRFVEGDLDDGAGNVAKGVGPAVFFKSSRAYKSRVRAPHSIALVKDLRVSGNFVLEVEMMQTGIETAHRDLCVFFGFEGPERFFYNHLGKVPDAHSSNVFKVDRRDRVRQGEISRREIDWGRGVWHRVRLECEWGGPMGGRVRTYFDDMETPAFDKRLFREPAGFVGLGSFDDAGAFRNLHVWAKEHSKSRTDVGPFGGEVVRRLWTDGAQSGELDIHGAGSAKVWILGEEYRVGMVHTRDGKVRTRGDGSGFFFDDGLAEPELDEDGKVVGGAWGAWNQARRKEYRWVISDPQALAAGAGLIGLDEAVVLDCGLAVTAEPFAEPDSSSGISLEPVYGVKLRVEPAKESRSAYLAKRYRASAGHPDAADPEGIWRWTTNLEADARDGLDPRPVLVAITPPGDPFSIYVDEVLEADERTREVLSKKYRCLRVDPTLVAGQSLRWPEKTRIELGRTAIRSSPEQGYTPIEVKLRGSAMCLRMNSSGRVYQLLQDVVPPAEFLSLIAGG